MINKMVKSLLPIAIIFFSCGSPIPQNIDILKDDFWLFEKLHGDIHSVSEKVFVNGLVDSTKSYRTSFFYEKGRTLEKKIDFHNRPIKNDTVFYSEGTGDSDFLPVRKTHSGFYYPNESESIEHYSYSEQFVHGESGELDMATYNEDCITRVTKYSYLYDEKSNLKSKHTIQTSTFCDAMLSAGAIDNQKATVKNVFTYDDKGRIIRQEESTDNSPWNSETFVVYEYNLDDHLEMLTESREDNDGLLYQKPVELADEWRQYRISTYHNGEQDYIQEIEYVFDENNNWIKKAETINLKNGESINYLTERDIKYY